MTDEQAMNAIPNEQPQQPQETLAPQPQPIRLHPADVLVLLQHQHLAQWLAAERDRLRMLAEHYAEQAAKVEREIAAHIETQYGVKAGALDLDHGQIIPKA